MSYNNNQGYNGQYDNNNSNNNNNNNYNNNNYNQGYNNYNNNQDYNNNPGYNNNNQGYNQQNNYNNNNNYNYNNNLNNNNQQEGYQQDQNQNQNQQNQTNQQANPQPSAPQPQPVAAATEFTFTIKSAQRGNFELTLPHQESLATLYSKVFDRFRSEDAYLKYNDRRLPNSPALISQSISTALTGSIVLDLVTASIDDVITIKYMCEKCGNIFHRNPDDAIECPANSCRHGILLKCRKEGTITSYDCR